MNAKLRKLLNSKPDPRWRGGRPCDTCQHPRIKSISADYRHFAQREGDARAVPWTVFFEYVRSEYRVGTSNSALRKHAVRCLGLAGKS